jgi:hypothetical protein
MPVLSRVQITGLENFDLHHLRRVYHMLGIGASSGGSSDALVSTDDEQVTNATDTSLLALIEGMDIAALKAGFAGLMTEVVVTYGDDQPASRGGTR